MKPEPGVVIFERFRLERLLGRGGMGSVWLARHLTLDVDCAVKFIEEDAGADKELRSRFAREAKAAAQIKSPNVVRILDYGVFEGTPYIAMEYLEGEDLAHRLERLGALGARETYAVVQQVSRALGKAHAAGIIHRDLKPENIFITQDEDGVTAKVLDFGVAKHTSVPGLATKTKTGALLGTPFYMSPEQARGTLQLDARSDLWSLAVIAYQCLTGKLPFVSDALGDLLAKIMFEDAPLPSSVAPGLPAGLDTWWKKAASRSPDDRFSSARELTDALGVALELGADALRAPAWDDTSARRTSAPTNALASGPTLAAPELAPAALGRTATADPVSRTFAGGRARSRRMLFIAGGAAAGVGVLVVVAVKLSEPRARAAAETAPSASAWAAPSTAPEPSASAPSVTPTSSAEQGEAADAAAPSASAEPPRATPRRSATKPKRRVPAAHKPQSKPKMPDFGI
jgi:eukaryotic-like serine/threonine-protein kinase